MRELGDKQTPPGLVQAIVARLGRGGFRWTRVFEPTCGCGGFLVGASAAEPPPRELLGIEIQPLHCEAARLALRTAPERDLAVTVREADVLALDLGRDLAWRTAGPLLVLGNPPWVTNAELGALGATRRPTRRNTDRLSGFAALTGASNFDLAESLWIKVLTELAGEDPTIAFLSKLETARRVLETSVARQLRVRDAFICRIDGRRWFGVTAEACLLVVQMGGAPVDAAAGWPARVPVFADLDATAPETEMGWTARGWVADLARHREHLALDGASPVTWRQGVKHDAAAVMELRVGPTGELLNGFGEPVAIEPSHRFPLLKATALRDGVFPPHREVVVTQRALNQSTDTLATEAPRLWEYLGRHRARLSARQSRVYLGRPDYAMFGVGPYAFAPFKVAVSGLHRPARFRALGPASGRPVLLDDTCYYAAVDSAAQAAVLEVVLDSEPVRQLLESLAPPGAKRPITQARLARLDAAAAMAGLDPSAMRRAAATRLAALDPSAPSPGSSLEEAFDWLASRNKGDS